MDAGRLTRPPRLLPHGTQIEQTILEAPAGRRAKVVIAWTIKFEKIEYNIENIHKTNGALPSPHVKKPIRQAWGV